MWCYIFLSGNWLSLFCKQHVKVCYSFLQSFIIKHCEGVSVSDKVIIIYSSTDCRHSQTEVKCKDVANILC